MKIIKEKETEFSKNSILLLIKSYDEQKKEKLDLDFDEWLDIVLFTKKPFQKIR